MSAEQAREAVPLVKKAWEDAGREKPVISLMTHGIIGSDPVDLLERAHRVAEIRGEDASDPEAYIKGLRENTLVGTVAEIGEQLSELDGGGRAGDVSVLDPPRPRRRRPDRRAGRGRLGR